MSVKDSIFFNCAEKKIFFVDSTSVNKRPYHAQPYHAQPAPKHFLRFKKILWREPLINSSSKVPVQT